MERGAVIPPREDVVAERDVDYVDDSGSRDFWFGVTGLGLCALIAIAFAIFS